MRNNRKKIIAILFLCVVAILGGVSVFVAYRLNTQKAVAPTAPESKPAAGTSCTGEGGSCIAGNNCLSGQAKISGTDCAVGQVCCVAQWTSSDACKMSFNVPQAACTPRPACFDLPVPCSIPEPVGGWCPGISCSGGKKMYKNVADNRPGSYNTDEANRIVDGSSVIPGTVIVYLIEHQITSSGKVDGSSAGPGTVTITDVLDSRLEYLDGAGDCKHETATNRVICTNGGTSITGSTTAKSTRTIFRAKVKDGAKNGDLINTATLSTSSIDSSGKTSETKQSVSCQGKVVVASAPTVAISCKSKTALTTSGTGIVSSVGKNQTFMYSMEIYNSGDSIANNVVVTDVLPMGKLIFVDSDSGCTYAEATKTVSCTATLNPKETKKLTFRVKTASDLNDGETITNTATAKLSTADAKSAGSDCTKVIKVALPSISAKKEAYRDNSNNTAGNYQLTDVISSVAKNQTFVYSVEVKNSGTATASGITLSDPLNGQNQDQLTYVDKDPRCEWNLSNRLIACSLDLAPGGTAILSFRVKVADTVTNGAVIKNVGTVSHDGSNITVNKDLTVSTVVGCNNTCTNTSECESGYTCDTASGKCRNSSCSTETSCVCPATATATPTPTPTTTVIATQITPQAVEPTIVVVAPTAAALPATGIFDIPGAAIFGGGLLMAVVGILLAL